MSTFDATQRAELMAIAAQNRRALDEFDATERYLRSEGYNEGLIDAKANRSCAWRGGVTPFDLGYADGWHDGTLASELRCQQCDGGGEVTWNPSPINDPQCAETATCPRCDGSGLDRSAA